MSNIAKLAHKFAMKLGLESVVMPHYPTSNTRLDVTTPSPVEDMPHTIADPGVESFVFRNENKYLLNQINKIKPSFHEISLHLFELKNLPEAAEAINDCIYELHVLKNMVERAIPSDVGSLDTTNVFAPSTQRSRAI